MSDFQPTYLILHHTGAEEADARQVKRYHLSLGWKDVGYHFIIERSGRVVAGRPANEPGAHTQAAGMNHKSLGIALIGNLEKHRPAAEQLTAVRALVKRLSAEYAIPPERVLGHREVAGASTLCPGKFFPIAQVRGAAGAPLYKVQVGAYREKENALKLLRELEEIGFPGFIIRD